MNIFCKCHDIYGKMYWKCGGNNLTIKNLKRLRIYWKCGGNNLSLSFYICNHVRWRIKPGGVCISNSNTMYRYQKLGSNSSLENTENWARLRVKVHFFRITALLLVPGGLPYIGARANSIRIYALGDLGCKLRLFTKWKCVPFKTPSFGI